MNTDSSKSGLLSERHLLYRLNHSALAKRVVDLCICVCALPVVIVVVIVCAVGIKVTSRGSVFFVQMRTGYRWRQFGIVKLRTMVPGAENLGAGLYSVQGDSRFTVFGLLLRRLSLDELPQIFNVLAGDMSLVGPRPLPLAIVKEHPAEYETILQVLPGITGLSQVTGRNALPRSRRIALDLQYAVNRNLRLDAWILMRTIGVVLFGLGQLNYQERTDVER